MSHKICCALALLLFWAAAVSPASAQEGAGVGEKIRQTQALINQEFRQILREEMMLTDSERDAFWPLYERYSAEKRQISERYLAALIEFVDRYHNGDLTDEHASRLTKIYFDVEMAILNKRRSYVSRFGEFLSPVKVMRFFQLENKVEAEVNAALAMVIPLADPR